MKFRLKQTDKDTFYIQYKKHWWNDWDYIKNPDGLFILCSSKENALKEIEKFKELLR